LCDRYSSDPLASRIVRSRQTAFWIVGKPEAMREFSWSASPQLAINLDYTQYKKAPTFAVG